MKDGAQASSYITEFQSLTAQIGDWGEHAYMHHFRKGLPSRILDQIAVHPSPIDNLQKLMDITLDLDVRYHELQKEKRSHTGSTHPSSTSQSSTSHSSTTRTSSKSRKKKFKSQPSSTPSNSTGSSKPAFKLNSFGKVRREEKERREKLGLCQYCGGNHTLEECQKRPNYGDKPSASSSQPSKQGKA